MIRSILTPLTLLLLLLAPWLSHGNDADRYGVVFHVDSDAKMNRILRQVGRHHAANHAMPTRVILISDGVKAALDNTIKRTSCSIPSVRSLFQLPSAN